LELRELTGKKDTAGARSSDGAYQFPPRSDAMPSGTPTRKFFATDPASDAVPAIACPCQTTVRITIRQGITSFVEVKHRAAHFTVAEPASTGRRTNYRTTLFTRQPRWGSIFTALHTMRPGVVV
jgi:hypothetical protein